MAEDNKPSPPRESASGPNVDLGMVCTCDAPATDAMRDVAARYHLDETRLVSDLMALLRRRFGVNDFRIVVDQWFGITFRLGLTQPPVRGVIAADEVEHALVAIVRHLDGTAPLPFDAGA